MSASVTPRAGGPRLKAALLMLTGSVGCVLGLGAAHASSVDSAAPSRVVRYSAESLATDSGVQQLYRRILGAARQVCPDESGNLAVNARVAACRAQAVAHAIQQIDNTRLAALYAHRSKSG
jgi:UrcA family protein